MKTGKSKYILLLFFFISATVNAQPAPFQVALEPVNISGLGGLQSFAWGQHNGKWLIVGGRLDGLHQRQPFAAFDAAGNNTQLLVIDPVTQQKWTAPLSSLPVGIREQMSSTNMEFYQEGDYLYLIGGYGYSNTAADHITYPNLCAVRVPDVINAIVNSTPFDQHVRQITDTLFAVTGGVLNKIYNIYHLTGGQKFIGQYNPMGPTHGPGFVQVYTNSSRKFLLADNGTTLSVSFLPSATDSVNLHRRDYNVVPQILPNQQEGLTAFSGVFQPGADLPFLNCVNIDSTGHYVNATFSQYYNHYHCAHIPLYDSVANEMHTLFFGGIAQYYDSAGVLVQDNNVPFVKTIARVTRDANGVMTEYKLPVEMPGYLGAGSEFIPLESLPEYNNGVLKLDAITADTTLLGYIYGGISSTAPNIFFINTGIESSASSTIYKVIMIRNSTTGLDQANKQSTGTLQMQVFPNPNDGKFIIRFNLKKVEPVTITVTDVHGQLIDQATLNDPAAGENSIINPIRVLTEGGIYFITVETKSERATQKIIVD
jgi:hypothetical protein